jgi:dTDP-4-amino-4,6-dideoxygalactose transaminase
MRQVPFNRAYATGVELEYIADAIRSTHLSGNGPFTKRCAEWLEQRVGVPRALMTHSCTGALEMAAVLVGIGPGDEVIMPSFTFVSTANAVVAHGGIPVFVDVREDTLNLDESKVEAAITRRTRAIIAVHYAGVACELDALHEIARANGLALIEDAAQAVLATYHGRELGGIGDVGALSFHETKSVMCGEGGALLVNHADWVDRAEVIHEKGTDRRRFLQGQVDKYTWQEFGSSYPMSDLTAAFLWAQLEAAEDITQRRMAIWGTYHEGLADLEARECLRRPFVPAHCVHNAHMYYVVLPEGRNRDELIRDLNERGVNAVFHYVPLHSAPAAERYARAPGNLEVTDRVSARLVRLPLWAGMEPADVDHVLHTLEHVLSRVPARSTW